MLIRPEGCNIRCPDARCRSKCRKIADWERQHARELGRYEPRRSVDVGLQTYRDKEQWEKCEAHIADLESRLHQIADLASICAEQVGTGPLLTNVRNGFVTICKIATKT